MFIEYNWTACVYICRFGNTPTDWRGHRSFDSLQEWRDVLALHGYNLRKCASRTWEVYQVQG